MAPQEIILSACSSEITSTSVQSRANTTPSILVNDLLTSAPLATYKNSTSPLHSAQYVQTSSGQGGGAIFAVQEGKALVNIWAWQKDQMHLKLHLPEKMSCFNVSPNGCWAVAGSPSGQLYLWELASGLLLASFTAHYRSITSLTFTPDSRLLLSSSLDASVHIFLVSWLVDEDDSGLIGKPYGTLGDHTLAIRAVATGATASSSTGRCWTASEDGTVKIWSLQPPFDLLTTFSFPPGIIPSTLAIDPTERFFYAATTTGEIYHIPLFRRRAELGSGSNGNVEAPGGGGQGSAPIKTEGSIISLKTPITTLTLSLSATHLLAGTHTGDIHIYSLPSHQHLRTISSHASPITHLSTLLKPPDLVGTPHRTDHWPIIEIKPFERMRVGKAARETQEVTMLLRPSIVDIDFLRPPRSTSLSTPSINTGTGEGDKLAEVLAENKRLRTNLDRAIKINERMWNGVIDLKLAGDEQVG